MNNQNKKIETRNLLGVFSSPKWIALVFILPLLAVFHFASAQPPEPGSVRFDHIRTGFNLTGAHILVRCETCHISGVFKGTPRDCATCHMAGNRMGAMAKPGQHVPTATPCDSCHRTTGWIPASYSHAGVAPGACMTCHNGSMSTGKPNGHTRTTESCDKCHRTTAWIPAGYNHLGVVPGTCRNCHGVTATGMPNGHVAILATDSCDKCHRTTAWLPVHYDHTGVVPGTCRNCHGVTATGMPNGHVAILATDSCDKCHSTTTWLGAAYNHVGVVPGTCANCHGKTATGVGGSPTTRYPNYTGHVPTTLWPSCDACHKSTTSFLNAKVHGSGAAVAGQCNVCHKHHNNTESCDKCHSTSKWD
jgi:hypothetical protein